MRFSTFCIATLLAVGAIGTAQATSVNLVTNGDFSKTTYSVNTPTQFGTESGGQFITGWTGGGGYEIWYPSGKKAVDTNATGQFSYTGNEKLYGPISAPARGIKTFVGLDGDTTPGTQASIGQELKNLIVGSIYTVTFDWAGAQMQSRTGATTEYLKVSFGDSSQDTATLDNTSKGFTGWKSASMQFVADSQSEFLNFLSVGTPVGYPPIALLADVSVTQTVTHNVPEPPVLAMFGGGLLGLGLLTVFSRRREMRRRSADGYNRIS